MKKLDFKGSVVLNPVPVVMITSRNKEGKDNVFTVAWAGTISTKPPMLSISVRPSRLSYEYIKESMEFVLNIASADMAKKVDYCGVRSGRTNDKIKEMGFTMKECTNINAAYIDDCPISIECKVKEIVELGGTHDMFIAEVLCSHISSDLMDEKGKLHFERGDLLAYCHGEYYKMPRNSIGSFGYSVIKKKTEEKKKNEKKKFKENKSTESKNKNSKNKNELKKKTKSKIKKVKKRI